MASPRASYVSGANIVVDGASSRRRLRMPTTAPEKLTPKGRATRERIVAAAAELMSQRGVARHHHRGHRGSRGGEHLADVSLLRRQS